MTTVRVWFTKTGEAAYISLLDLQRVMQRALKRARLPVWYTQGFNPHIYMTFAAPLALGQESLVESLDCKMEPLPENWQHHKKALVACMQDYIKDSLKKYKVLTNYISKDNTKALRVIKKMGAEFGDEVETGGKTFVRFTLKE